MKHYRTNACLRALFLRFLWAGLTLFLFNGTLFAATANLAWDASTSSNVGGYKVSYGISSGNYTSTIDAGNTTTYALAGLQDGTQYYVAVKAYDSTKTIESTYSNEVNMTTPVSTTLTADFTANPTSGAPGMVVNFTPVTTGTVTSWAWRFSGSYTPSVTNSTGQVVTVTYPTAGTYSVSLTTTGPSGSVTKTKSNFITVSTAPPIANFSATPTSGITPVTVSFTDSSTGSITGRSWNFGDGSTSTEINPTHIYSVAGNYTVSLTVTGSGGSNTKTSTNFISVSAAPPPTPSGNYGLVAAYGFEEVSGTTVADASGQGNHGTIKEAVRITAGKYGKALKFDGVNDWVTVNDSASLDLTTGMTLEAWVYPTVSQNSWTTVLMKEGSGQLVYSLHGNSDWNQPAMIPWIGGEQIVSGGPQLTPGQWWHLAATYDGITERLYVNGTQVASKAQTGSILTSTGALRIGGNSIWGQYFKGYIDEVRIYNRALNVTEVLRDTTTAISVSNPVKFVMGSTNLEPWADYRNQGVAEAFQAIPQKSALVTSVKVYLTLTSTATQLVAGIYKNINGHPGALIAKGTLSTLKSGAWNEVPIPVASVTAAQPYWIAILGSKGQIGFLDQVGSGTSIMETSASTTLTTLPSTWAGSVSKPNAAMSAHGNGY